MQHFWVYNIFDQDVNVSSACGAFVTCAPTPVSTDRDEFRNTYNAQFLLAFLACQTGVKRSRFFFKAYGADLFVYRCANSFVGHGWLVVYYVLTNLFLVTRTNDIHGEYTCNQGRQNLHIKNVTPAVFCIFIQRLLLLGRGDLLLGGRRRGMHHFDDGF